MDNILDENASIEAGNKFSKLSFITSLVSGALVMYLVSFLPRRIKANEFIELPPNIIPILVVVSISLGLVFSILSIRRKEKWNFLKPIGNTLNILLAIFIFGAVFYARILEYLRM